jgi:hypothetical protein
MKKTLIALLTGVLLTAVAPAIVLASPGKPHTSNHGFYARLTGNTIYANLSGFEPDFDPIVRIIIVTEAHAKGLPPLHLLLDAYIEQFQTDTQPVLPDLIHPKIALSTTLGGFFSGKAMIVGPSNQILFTGDLLAEALINPYCMTVTTKIAPPQCRNETQHMLVTLFGQGVAKGGKLNLKSVFIGNHQLRITSGNLYGTAYIPPRAISVLSRGGGSMAQCKQPPAQVKSAKQRAEKKAAERCINKILKDFQVPPPIMRGTAGTGRPGKTYCIRGHCTNPSATAKTTTARPSSGGSSRPAWMAPLGGALIGLALILLVIYFWQTRKERQQLRLQKKLPGRDGRPAGEHGSPSP